MEVSKRPKAAGLSIKVEGIKGPIVDGELPKCKDFGRRMANQVEAWQNTLNALQALVWQAH